MATTTNYGWTTPDNTALVKDGALAIRTLGSAIDTTVFNNFQTVVKSNLIINGNFTINQRSYVSAANLASGSYGFDRWKSNFTNTTLTYTSDPAGQSVTINNGGGLQQIVERANVPAGTYVLSFSGTATGRIYNSGATPPSYAASPITFTADGLENVVVEFTATGSTKTLSKVKLELGSTATAFVYAGGTIQGELAACQRYYYRAQATAAYSRWGTGQCTSSTAAAGFVKFPITMRTSPTALEQNGTASNYGLTTASGGVNALSTVPTFDSATPDGSTVVFTGPSVLTAGDATQLLPNGTTAPYLGWSAEL